MAGNLSEELPARGTQVSGGRWSPAGRAALVGAAAEAAVGHIGAFILEARTPGIQVGSVVTVTIASLTKGLLVLVALLIAAGALGGIGSVELLIWLGLVAAWIIWWMVSRRKAPSKP
jgi:hypothetical protein